MNTPFDATLTDVARAPLPPTGRASLAGTQLAHFALERPIGRGGMGEVYEARDLALDRRVAVKILPREIAESRDLRDRFYREARAQARLGHPNICHIYYVGEQDGQLFFAMEYVDGQSLQELIDERGSLGAEEALELGRMAALGLQEAHRHGFTHRDIKPSNLMVARDGTLKIVDFGLVKRTHEPGAAGTAVGAPEMTALVGTPLYMAPEQASGDAVDLRADIYSLGATLHHAVTGKPPFHGDTAVEILSRKQSEHRPRIAERGAERRRHAPLDALLDRMMATVPAARFGDYRTLITEMERISPARTRPAGFWVRAFAAVLDFAIVLLTLLPLDVLVGVDEDNTVFLLAVPYLVLLVGRYGRTLGMTALELEVSRVDGVEPVGLARAAVRAGVQLGLIVLAVSLELAEPYLAPWADTAGTVMAAAGMGLALLLLVVSTRTSDKRALWDRVAGTQVRYRRLRPSEWQ